MENRDKKKTELNTLIVISVLFTVIQLFTGGFKSLIAFYVVVAVTYFVMNSDDFLNVLESSDNFIKNKRVDSSISTDNPVVAKKNSGNYLVGKKSDGEITIFPDETAKASDQKGEM